VVVVGDDNICTPGGTWGGSERAEIGTLATATWAAIASLPKPRDRFVLLSLGDGSALVVGGTSLTTATSGPSSFRSTFRLAAGGTGWTRSGDLNTARSAPAGAVLADGRVLIAGGYYTPSLHMLRSAEVFSPSTGAWSTTGSLSTARYGATAVTLADGRVLVVGGWADVVDGAAPLYGIHPVLASTELYDPATELWSAGGDLPQGVAEASVVALKDGGALLVVGLVVTRFDPGSGTWTVAASMIGSSRARTLVALPDGTVLAAGGLIGEEGHAKYSSEAEIYDPATDTWTATAPMPVARSSGTAVLLEDGSVLIVGGAFGNGALGDPYCPMGGLAAVRYIP
jgi:N-acetylneuraminic acid mutarotase